MGKKDTFRVEGFDPEQEAIYGTRESNDTPGKLVPMQEGKPIEPGAEMVTWKPREDEPDVNPGRETIEVHVDGEEDAVEVRIG